EALLDGVEQGRHRSLLRDVAGYGNGRAARLLDRGDDLLGALGAAGVVHGHGHAVGGQCVRDRAADPARAPGHDRYAGGGLLDGGHSDLPLIFVDDEYTNTTWTDSPY